MKNNIAYCGLNCELCPAYIATKTNDDKLREKVAKEWSEWNHATITPEMINCDGCREDGRKFAYCESLCPIKKCAVEKEFRTCGDCENLDSCEKIKEILSNDDKAYDNLKAQK